MYWWMLWFGYEVFPRKVPVLRDWLQLLEVLETLGDEACLEEMNYWEWGGVG